MEVKWQCVYPGITVVDKSAEAAQWSAALGIPFHEATIEAHGLVDALNRRPSERLPQGSRGVG